MNKNNKFQKFFFIFIGSLIFFYIIYRRFFYIRIPRKLFTNLPINLICIYSIICLCFFIYILILIYKIIKQPNLQNNSTFLENYYIKKIISFFSTFNEYYYESLRRFNDYVTSFFNELYLTILVKINFIIWKYVKYPYAYYINWILNFIPRLIIATMFMIDVMYFHEFYYFYKSLILLILPLFYTYLIYTIKNFCKENIIDIPKYLIIEYYDPEKEDFRILLPNEYVVLRWNEYHEITKNIHELYLETYLLNENFSKFRFRFSPSYMQDPQNFSGLSDDEIMANLHHIYLNINKLFIYPALFITFLEMLKKHVYGDKIQLICMILYFISWVYILLYGLHYI